ncbi:MAG TPA: chorismate-binding protein [Myxococcales bacterium]|nr:chorismate-binding protein [Myxococcales bacterium]
MRGRRARLFVGAGIVEGSEASAEWDETELKARALLGALGAAP